MDRDPEGDLIPMDNQGREYRYQADYTFNGKMFHVRCDDWVLFQEAVKNIEDTYIVDSGIGEVKTIDLPTYSQAPYPTPEADSACKTCGGPTLPEKRIVAKTGKAYWVRDCATGDRSHKGPIRPAS